MKLLGRKTMKLLGRDAANEYWHGEVICVECGKRCDDGTLYNMLNSDGKIFDSYELCPECDDPRRTGETRE